MYAKTIIIIILSCLLMGILTFLIVFVIRKLMRKKQLSFVKSLIVVICGGAASAAIPALFMTFVYYHAVPPAWSYIEGGEQVTVSREGNAYFFDGPGEDKALIFYPGALVETEAYSQLMYMIAENGVDTFLVDMPFRFALIGMSRADEILESHTYSEWYMSGHSLGGMVASEYCVQTKNNINGVILLAAYPIRKLDSGISVCMISGSEDLVLSRKRFENGRSLCTGRVEELYIEGGNHAQFGSYGEQLNDGKAEISSDEQKRISADEIIKFVNER